MTEIMIVEDEKELVELYEQFLTKGGYKIAFKAFNGKEAIEYYDRIKEYPDVILMDHRMPIKNGISACEYILETNKKQQIIFISADDSVKTEIERMGIKFLTKPFSFKLLVNIIENELLRGKKIVCAK